MADRGAYMALLSDGRLHLQQGPIDLIISAWGSADEVRAAYEQAAQRFDGLLDELVAELALLRQPLGTKSPLLTGPVARRMAEACWPYRRVFITPMAAVAGSVAEEILAHMIRGRQLARALVNNGGDIALHITPGNSLEIGVAALQAPEALLGRAKITFGLPVRGVATSGWRGRSQSLGVADGVTVFAATAAAADAAATIIANAVNCQHPAVLRRPAREVKADSDLGELAVTVAVGPLPQNSVKEALDAGHAVVEDLRRAGLVHAAFLDVQGWQRVIGCEALAANRSPPGLELQYMGEMVA